MRDLVRQIVSSYQAIKLQGQGRGYVQFTAQEPDSQQPVVIKILPQALGKDPQIEQRFRALSQTIRQLNHPNITPVRDVGEKSGLPYLVVRALEKAQPLADRLNQPWAIDAAADVVMQAGQALEHAYNKGLVHGALTPGEIQIQPDGRVLVSDFGLTQLLSLDNIKVEAEKTPFISPERAAGQAAEPRSDVYSLAAILYQLLARRAPQIVQGQVLAPGRFNPDVPAAMDAVVVKALAPNPSDRYPDVKAFLAALGAVTLLPAVLKPAQPAATAGPAAAPSRPAAAPEPQGIRCPRCGAENQVGRFCKRCGTRLQIGLPGQPPAPAAKPPAPAAKPPAPAAKPQTPAAKPPAPAGKPHGPGGLQGRPGAGRPPAVKQPPALSGQPIRAPGQIQITKIDVGSIEMGKGIETTEITIVSPLTVATGDLAGQFPEPVAMPSVDTSSLSMSLGDPNMPQMPAPPPIPTINWADMVPPLSEVPKLDEAQGAPPGA